MNLFRSYLKMYQGQAGAFTAAILISILQSLLMVPVALLVKSIFDHSLPEKNFNHLAALSSVIFLLYLINGGLTLWTRRISLKTTKKVIRKIRDQVTEKMYLLPREYYSRGDRMTLHARVVQDTFRIDVMSNGLVAQLFPSFLISGGLLLLLLYLDVPLTLLILFITPFLLLFGRYAGKKLSVKVKLYHRYFEKFSKRVMVLLNIIDLTRVSATEKKEMAEQSRLHHTLQESSFDQAWYGAFYHIFNQVSASSIGVLILLFGGYRVIHGEMTLGELFAFITALGLMKRHTVIISSVIPKVIEGMESLSSIFSFLGEIAAGPYQGTNKIRFRGNIEFDSVSFNYGRGELLDNISFSLLPGEVVCITGPNGSGKSTIINLLLGFYRPLTGRIEADGKSYDEILISDVMRFTGVVFQETFIFPGTIRENIVYGSEHIDEQTLQKAVRISDSETFIENLPEGINTRIHNKYENLSGGEIQKIAIARSVAGDKKLIIMDEPTTYLDRLALKKIIDNIKECTVGCSILLISHNSEVAAVADKVFTIENNTLRRVRA